MLGASALRRWPPACPAQTAVPEIAFDSAADLLKLPADIVSRRSGRRGHQFEGPFFVYTRTGHPTVGLGNSRLFTHGGSRLFEFDQNGKFVREIGQGVYAAPGRAGRARRSAGQHLDRRRGSNQVVKFDPDGRVLMILGRKPEAISIRSSADSATAPARGRGGLPGAGGAGDQFNRPSDVAWDADGNIFVADGHGNARIAKFDRERTLPPVVGRPRVRAGPVQHAALDRDRRAGQRLRRRPGQQAHPGLRQRRHLRVADHQRRRADRDLHLTRVASVPLQLAHRRRVRDGRRGDLQAGARRPGRRQIRDGRKAAEGVRPRQRDRLPHRRSPVRRRADELARAEADAPCGRRAPERMNPWTT